MSRRRALVIGSMSERMKLVEQGLAGPEAIERIAELASTPLEAALWAFGRGRSFEHGALLAVNLGDDADTTGAVYGQLAGTFYGVDGIPGRWRERIAKRAVIEDLAMRCYRAFEQGRHQTS
jgi:ADP-ribosylglycohydrolase